MSESFQAQSDHSGSQSFSDQEGNNANQENQNGQQSEVTLEYNGKQMSQQDILNKLENADKHINTLESERQQDRERVEKLIGELEKANESKATMDQLMARLDGKEGNADEQNDPSKSVDFDKLAERAAEQAWDRMTQREQERKKEDNLKEISGKLYQKYGDKTDEIVFSAMQELGYSKEEAFDLAGKRPKAFLKMIGFEDSPSNTSPNTTTSTQMNRYGVPPVDKSTSGDMIGTKETKGRVAAYESRVEAKMKELGINT